MKNLFWLHNSSDGCTSEPETNLMYYISKISGVEFPYKVEFFNTSEENKILGQKKTKEEAILLAQDHYNQFCKEL